MIAHFRTYDNISERKQQIAQKKTVQHTRHHSIKRNLFKESNRNTTYFQISSHYFEEHAFSLSNTVCWKTYAGFQHAFISC